MRKFGQIRDQNCANKKNNCANRIVGVFFAQFEKITFEISTYEYVVANAQTKLIVVAIQRPTRSSPASLQRYPTSKVLHVIKKTYKNEDIEAQEIKNNNNKDITLNKTKTNIVDNSKSRINEINKLDIE